MKRTKQLLGATSAITLVALHTSPALAAGTSAGDTITNNVSVSFDVGGVTQTAVTDSDTFTVDRKVNLTVAEVGGTDTSVSPGETAAAATFQVTNSSNDAVDLALSLVQSATDDFDITNVRYYVDDGDGVFDAGDTLVTYLDEVAADATITVHVVGDISLGAATGDRANVSLVATAHEASGATGSLGAALTATTGSNTAGVDTVLADGAGDEDVANDGAFSDTDSFVVSAAAMSVAKASRIVSDPVNGTTNPKGIPGAVVEYCIAVSNAPGSATATKVVVNDKLPADVSYDSTFGIFVNGDSSCAAGSRGDNIAVPTATYSAAGHEIDGTLSDIAAGLTRSVYFRVTIN